MDLQAQMPADFDISHLSRFEDPLYVSRQETVEFSGQLEAGPVGLATRTTRRTNGIRLCTADGLQVALMRDNGFTFARLAPYDRWDTFSAEGLRLWAAYVEVASPSVVVRLGLRYINQIRLPPGESSISKFLRTRPEISDDMPNATDGFFMSMDVPLPDHQADCRITETIIRTEEGVPALVLDIDVSRSVVLDPSHTVTLADVFSTLRDAKNLVFEASITDDARELFD